MTVNGPMGWLMSWQGIRGRVARVAAVRSIPGHSDDEVIDIQAALLLLPSRVRLAFEQDAGEGHHPDLRFAAVASLIAADVPRDIVAYFTSDHGAVDEREQQAWREREYERAAQSLRDEVADAIPVTVNGVVVGAGKLDGGARSRMGMWLAPDNGGKVIKVDFSMLLGPPHDTAPAGEFINVLRVLEPAVTPERDVSIWDRRWRGLRARLVLDRQGRLRRLWPV